MARRLTLDETKNCLRLWRELANEEALEVLTICNGGLIVFLLKNIWEKVLLLKNCSRLVMRVC